MANFWNFGGWMYSSIPSKKATFHRWGIFCRLNLLKAPCALPPPMPKKSFYSTFTPVNSNLTMVSQFEGMMRDWGSGHGGRAAFNWHLLNFSVSVVFFLSVTHKCIVINAWLCLRMTYTFSGLFWMQFENTFTHCPTTWDVYICKYHSIIDHNFWSNRGYIKSCLLGYCKQDV